MKNSVKLLLSFLVLIVGSIHANAQSTQPDSSESKWGDGGEYSKWVTPEGTPKQQDTLIVRDIQRASYDFH